MNGFAIQEKSGLQLYADQAVTADLQMKVLGAQSRVEVSAAPSLIDTQNSDITDVLTGSALLSTPVLSRENGDVGIYGDMYFMPGVQNANATSGTPVINGGREIDTMVTMDGMIVMANISEAGGTPIQPSEETIQEMHTVLANSPAEFWRPAAISVITKSGTNQFHGSAFYEYNNTFLNAKDFFATSIPKRVENNFAASVGGPIKKDKLFFFAAYEGGRNSQDLVVTTNVPLPAWTTGNFSSITTQQLIDPYTGVAYPNNTITSGISPVSQAMQSVLYPAPNYGAPGLLSGNYRELIPTYGNGFTNFNNGDATFYYSLSKKDTLFLRNSYRELPVQSFTGSLPAVGNFVEERDANSGVITETHIFSSALINEFRFGYTDMKLSDNSTFDGKTFLMQAGMTGPWVTDTPSNPPILDVPSISISGITGASGSTGIDDEEDYEWNDNLSWTHGRHLLKFGVDQILDHYRGNTNPGTIYGGYTFTGAYTGNAYADFLLGLPYQTTLTQPVPISQVNGVLIGAYAQDQFQVNPRLTLNYGLRWEYQGPYSGAPYLMYSFNPKTGAEVVQTQASLSQVSPYFPSYIPLETAAEAGYPSNSLMFSHYLNFYPRVGFAYRLFPHAGTVLRGAYGVYGDNIYSNLTIQHLGDGGPFGGSAIYYNKFTSNSPLPGSSPLFSFPKPFQSAGTLSTQVAAAGNPNLTIPYTQQWNLSLQQQIGSNGIVTVAYIGTASRQLLYNEHLNQPPPSKTLFVLANQAYPNYSTVDWVVNGGVENYNSFQISMHENRGKNLSVDTGLTVAKDLTDMQDIGSYNGITPENRFCLGCEYGHNDTTKRLNFYLNGSYVLPFGRGQHFFSNTNRWEDGIIGGWNIAADAIAMSGDFFSLLSTALTTPLALTVSLSVPIKSVILNWRTPVLPTGLTPKLLQFRAVLIQIRFARTQSMLGASEKSNQEDWSGQITSILIFRL